MLSKVPVTKSFDALIEPERIALIFFCPQVLNENGAPWKNISPNISLFVTESKII